MALRIDVHHHHRMTRDERDTWAELRHVSSTRVIAVVSATVVAAIAWLAFARSAALGLALLFAAPLLVLAVVTLTDALFSER